MLRPILSQMNAVHALPSCFFTIHFNIICIILPLVKRKQNETILRFLINARNESNGIVPLLI
jgi:hypothetical protein